MERDVVFPLNFQVRNPCGEHLRVLQHLLTGKESEKIKEKCGDAESYTTKATK